MKIIKKNGSAKLRHVPLIKVNLASTYEAFEDPHCSLEDVNTKEQVADVFTKALSPQSLDHALRLMGVLYPASAASGDASAPVKRKRCGTSDSFVATPSAVLHFTSKLKSLAKHAAVVQLLPHRRWELKKYNVFPSFPVQHEPPF